MSSYRNSSIYYINSASRISGTNGQFCYSIPIPSNSNYDRVCLLQANIPISYYIVPLGENTFTLTEMGVPITVTVPIGNYNVNSFKTVVIALLNAASQHSWVYNISFPISFTAANTAKFTYSVSGNGVNQPSFTFTTNLHEQFGFNSNTTNTFVSSSMTSNNVVSFIPENSLFIRSDIVDDGNENILQEIFNNNAQPLSNAVFLCPDVQGFSKRLRTTQSSVYTFSITDADGRGTQLNGVACHFSLILFKRDDFGDIFKQFMKYSVLQSS